MKMRSRLTALVLAVLMLISTAAPALAADALPLSVYQSMVDSAANQATSQPVIDEGGTLTDAATYIPQQKDLPIYESTTVQELSVLPAGSETAVTVALPQKGKVQLSVGTDGGQWQAEMLGQWINLTGETGASCDVTYAKIKSLLDLNGEAKLRWLAADGESASQIAVITLVAAVAAVSAEGTDGEDVPVVAAAQPRMMMMGARSGVSTTNVKETYYYVINYVFEDNTVVADSYTANLAEGEAFTATVTFPGVVGYLPYVNNEQVNSYTFDVQSVSEDITITVVYKPTNVNYTVIHYQQNVDNDNYTPVEQETKQGLTKDLVPDVAKEYAGFYALLYEKPTIAADGSTLVEVYYDRVYYLINFDLGGGYGTEPIYARYGAPVAANNPTRAGYTFKGWSLDGVTAVELPETVPANNVTYIALWQVNDTAQVKVVFWGENPNNEGYSYLTTGVVDVKPGTKYTFAEDSTVFLTCGKEEHTHTAECQLTCGKEEHITHTEECFGCEHGDECSLGCYSAGYYDLVETEKPDANLTETHDGIYTYTTNYGYLTHYYLYLDGKWYCAEEGNWGGGDTTEIEYVCTHEHTADCYKCEYHEHTAACYSCGKEGHTHDESCNQYGSGLDSSLWTFVRSETVTVEADGSSVINVYYDRKTFTITFKATGNNGATLDTITDKWGADIKERFEEISKEHTFLWSMKTNGDSPWTSFLDVMPKENRTYYAKTTSSTNAQTATYLVQKIGTTAGNTANYEALYTVTVRYGNNLTVSVEEFVEIEGFTFNSGLSTKTSNSYNGAKFYYDRHNYAIEFYSPTTLLQKTEGIPYDSALSSYNWTPADTQAPVQYEPGSVTFEGWYLNPECTGDKFDFETSTMPAGTNDGDTTLTLYAKWIPLKHKVEFYLDQTTYQTGTKLETHPYVEVAHGSLIDPVPAEPENGDYTFVGWFYMDNGVEKAFDFDNMPITKDMQVYGKWSSNVLKQYFVYFKLQGTETEIAEPITGSALAGTTKTFEAKGGTELKAGYQEGYFPLVQSHSMTVDIADNTKNVYTFEYVQKDAVPYTVYYVTKTQNADGTLEEIELDGKIYYLVAETYTNSENCYAVVTEKFEPVTGYMPDAYQKRLVVDGSDGAVNQIIFIYTVDTEHAYYKITHYTQNNDLETWTEYSSSEVKGDIGSRYTGTAQTIPGYTYDHIEYVVNGETVAETDITDKGALLTADGLEINLYYVLNEYPYQVRYLEQNTGKVLAEPKDGKGKYGQVISESAIGIDGYTAVAPTAQTLNIRIETPAEGETEPTVKLNVITFYYTEDVVPIHYVVVGVEGSGTVSLNDTDETTVPAASVTESVKVLTGTAMGATAAPSSTVYKFVGWYSDAACENLISTDLSYVPQQPSHVDNGETVLDQWQEATYYAKFEYNLTSLTIKKSGVDLDKDPGVSFVFNVEGNEDDTDLDVAINENGSVTIYGLTVGNTYTVSEVLGNWRYSANPSTKQITLAVSGNTVQFENKRNSDAWLDGDCYDENVFTAVSQ